MRLSARLVRILRENGRCKFVCVYRCLAAIGRQKARREKIRVCVVEAAETAAAAAVVTNQRLRRATRQHTHATRCCYILTPHLVYHVNLSVHPAWGRDGSLF